MFTMVSDLNKFGYTDYVKFRLVSVSGIIGRYRDKSLTKSLFIRSKSGIPINHPIVEADNLCQKEKEMTKSEGERENVRWDKVSG